MFRYPLVLPIYHFTEEHINLKDIKIPDEDCELHDTYFYTISAVSEEEPGKENSNTCIYSNGELFITPFPLKAVLKYIQDARRGDNIVNLNDN